MRMNPIESSLTELIGINPNFQIEWIRSIRISPNDSEKFGFIRINSDKFGLAGFNRIRSDWFWMGLGLIRIES